MKEQQAKFNINLKILPFAQVSVEIKNFVNEKRGKSGSPFVYSEIKTTNPDVIEITSDGTDYGIPKTTANF